MLSRLHVYFIKQAGSHVFTVEEHTSYLKAKMKDDDERMLMSKKKKKLARTLALVARPPITSSKVSVHGLHGTAAVAGAVPPVVAGSDHPSEDDKFRELDAADRIRALDHDSDTNSELSDADSDLTAIGSMFLKLGYLRIRTHAMIGSFSSTTLPKSWL